MAKCAGRWQLGTRVGHRLPFGVRGTRESFPSNLALTASLLSRVPPGRQAGSGFGYVTRRGTESMDRKIASNAAPASSR